MSQTSSSDIRALVVAGSHSGCGKTSVALGLMAALADRGLSVAPAKCGPDFIDPSLHRIAARRESVNLDLAMCSPGWVSQRFARQAAGCDCAVVEGVMGLFDGGPASTAAVAKHLDLPVLLVLDGSGSGESVAAQALGFAAMDPDLRLAGVVVNRVGSPRHRQLIRRGFAALPQPIPLLGFLPRADDLAIPSRHLGLYRGEDGSLDPALRAGLGRWLADHLDLDHLLAHCRIPRPAAVPLARRPPRLRLAVARDAAFSFYYRDNLELLAAAGAELAFFSPLADTALPPDTGALYLGGGYPELFAAQLAANQAMRRAVAAFAASGRPVYGECGGFLYLGESLTDADGSRHPMCGVLPARFRMGRRRAALGYRTLRLARDCCWGQAGAELRGHEFHYSTLESMGPGVSHCYHLDDTGCEGYSRGSVLASYIHLHLGGSPEAAAHFVDWATGRPSSP